MQDLYKPIKGSDSEQQKIQGDPIRFTCFDIVLFDSI